MSTVQLDEDDYDTIAEMLNSELMKQQYPVGVLLFLAIKILMASHEKFSLANKGECEDWHELVEERFALEMKR